MSWHLKLQQNLQKSKKQDDPYENLNPNVQILSVRSVYRHLSLFSLKLVLLTFYFIYFFDENFFSLSLYNMLLQFSILRMILMLKTMQIQLKSLKVLKRTDFLENLIKQIRKIEFDDEIKKMGKVNNEGARRVL